MAHFTTLYESKYIFLCIYIIYSSIDLDKHLYIYIYTLQYTHHEGKFTIRGTEDYKYSFLLL